MPRQTKIIATLGPAVASEGGVRSLVEAGMDVARLNFSHGEAELHRKSVDWVRQAATDTGRVVGIMQDIQGPKLRVGEFPGGSVELDTDQEVELVTGSAQGDDDTIPIGYESLLEDVETGHRVLLADGLVHLEVTGQGDRGLRARVVSGG
ncbi:MAG: pyruvate kinase, partial [Acidimicrobiia bacterium]